MSVDSYYSGYKDNGFWFTDEILTRYALSLSTKPFVILSGISGTGKSKIAQLFEVPGLIPAPAPAPAQLAANNYVLFTIRKGFLSSEGRGNFKYEDTPIVLSPQDSTAIEAERRQILGRHGGEQNFQGRYEVTLETPDPNCPEVRLEVYVQRASNPLLRVRSKSRAGETPAWDSRDFFSSHYQVGDVLKLVPVGPRRLRIEAQNQQNDVDEAAEDRAKELASVSNKCFIPVKSNWVDSSDLFGYYNALTQEYFVTDLVRFLLEANEYPELPFFLILDEMNLSKVEHYFSDFLSCLESRVYIEGTLCQEPISLHSGADSVRTSDEVYDEISSKIELPLNLYVTGTVNIDDSTHMFSPKVLDRANVIEFNDVNLDAEALAGLRLDTFPDFNGVELARMSHFGELPNYARDVIEGCLSILKRHNQHFGFRTISEMSLFIRKARTHVGESEETIHKALDFQLLQKVLPKFSGSVTKLGEPLKELIHYLSHSEVDIDSYGLEHVDTIDYNGMKYPLTLRKLSRMYRTLMMQGFVNFIE